jgi:hypothetical protein
MISTRRMIGSAQRLTRKNSWPLLRARLQRSTAPILVGPWRGEVGFEALYWVPFLRTLGISPDRLIPVTRGGAHVWYPATRHVELYTLRTPKDLRVENTLNVMRTGMLKPYAWTAFDRAVIKDAAKSLGLTRYHTLHPSWMYWLLEDFWNQRRGLGWLGRYVDIQTLPTPVLDGLTLPEAFVAVRFYARATFPLTDLGQTIATETIKQLATQYQVIVLNPGIHADDHIDFPLKAIPNVMRLSDLCKITPENNLAVQSAVIAKAMGFVGTYGGLAQLALLYKKPTVSFYTDWHGTAIAHKHYADAIATQLGVACQVSKVTEIPLLHSVLPKVEFTVAGSSSGARKAQMATTPPI